MEIYDIIAYVALALFVTSIILWYLSGKLLKERNPRLSRTFVYIGGFMFSFAILFGLAALIIWSSH